MFTGIVEELGRVIAIDRRTGATGFRIECQQVLAGTLIGDSIAVNGVCLTVVALDETSFATEAVPETLRRTNLGFLEVGQPVNLERALAAGRAMGGHYVQGHIDGTAKVVQRDPEGEAVNYRFEVALDLARYIVPKGFVAVDGASLTVVDAGQDFFSVTLIPHTQEWTVLGKQGVGYTVNIEVDIMAKYAERILGDRLTALEEKVARLLAKD